MINHARKGGWRLATAAAALTLFAAVAALHAAEDDKNAGADDHGHKHDESRANIHPLSGRKYAPVMGVGGWMWLERDDRMKEERPYDVIKAMELEEDSVVADIGCGSGYFTRRIAKFVPKGKVYGVDIQPGMIDILKKTCAEEEVTNVIPVLGEVDDPKLPKGGIDRMLLVDVYHEFENPQPMLAKMLAALSPEGRIILVEYRLLGDTARHIKTEHRMSVKQVLAEWNPAGFELVDLIEDLPAQHVFIFRRRPEYSKTNAPAQTEETEEKAEAAGAR